MGKTAGGAAHMMLQLIWYNSSMIGSDVEGLSESSITEQLDANGAGLGDYSIEISVSAAGRYLPDQSAVKRR